MACAYCWETLAGIDLHKPAPLIMCRSNGSSREHRQRQASSQFASGFYTWLAIWGSPPAQKSSAYCGKAWINRTDWTLDWAVSFDGSWCEQSGPGLSNAAEVRRPDWSVLGRACGSGSAVQLEAVHFMDHITKHSSRSYPSPSCPHFLWRAARPPPTNPHAALILSLREPLIMGSGYNC